MTARLDVKCPAFAPDGAIPEEYTWFGEDLSPEISIGKIGAGVRSLAVIMDDLNVPVRGELTHWIIWNLLPSSVIPKAIPHGARIPSGAVQGHAYGKHCYSGPRIPFFLRKAHSYRFSVYALDTLLDIPDNSGKKELLDAMNNHVFQMGETVGWYRNG